MRTVLTIIIIIIYSRLGLSQVNKPDANLAPTLTPLIVPVTYPTATTTNFTRIWTARIPLQNPDAFQLKDNEKYQEATIYIDGLGRPLQEVVKKSSPDGLKDLVTSHLYDGMAREATSYLPYPATTTASSEGSFRIDPFTDLQSYYNTNYNDQRPYGQTIFEASPLSRPIISFAPGNTWMGSQKPAGSSSNSPEYAIRNSYEVNTEVTEVYKWTVGNNEGDIPTFSLPYYYQPGELRRVITVDERGMRVIEYKDKEDHVVLKKVELPASAATASDKTSHNGWLCTYYVYDVFGLLRFVLQPKLVQYLVDNGFPSNVYSITSTQADELCFQYSYDSHNRLNAKKVPGAGWVYMIYDKGDRLCLTQDAAQRNLGKWLVTQYDEQNRPTRSYLWENAVPRSTHEANANTSLNYPTLSGTYELLTETYYDGYDWVSTSGSGLPGELEDYSLLYNGFLPASNTTPPYPQETTPDYQVKGRVTGTKVNILGTSMYLYTVMIYDAYGRVIQVHSTNQFGSRDVVSTQYSFDGKPLVTCQAHQLSPSNYGNELSIVTRMNYDQAGRLLTTTQQISDGYTYFPETTLSENEYDDLGKLKTKKLGLQQNPGGANNYGHPGYTTTPLETLDYTYNIRGWLTGINRGYANPDKYVSESLTQTDRWFGMELAYDHGFTTSQYNGNIAGTVWRSKGDGKTRAYGFDYDAANRLLKADFTQNQGLNSWGTTAGINYSMQMGNGSTASNAYDANGNILAMQQYGYKFGSGSTVIDHLQYQYFTNTNKLQSVTEQGSGAAVHKLGDFTDGNTAGDDYGYDVNGNLVTDKNKQLATNTGSTTGLNVTAANSAIQYNHLNLPRNITVDGKGSIAYTYDAMGNKLSKQVTENINGSNRLTTTYYTGGFVYEQVDSDPVKLQYFGQAEGRVRPVEKPVVNEYTICGPGYWEQDDSGNWVMMPGTCTRFLFFNSYKMYVYDYMVKDHLGNVRAVLTDEQQQQNYPAATMETDQQSLELEKQFYTINDANIIDIQQSLSTPPTYENKNGFINPNPHLNTFATSQKMYRLNGSIPGAKKGLDMVLKVMAGDRFDIFGKSYHNSGGHSPQSFTQSFLTLLLDGLLGAPGGAAVAGSHGVSATTMAGNTAIAGPLQALQQLQQNSTTATGNPQAGICWVLFDEQFNIVDKNFSPVSSGGTVYDHYVDARLQDIAVGKNGYLYVFCSNESAANVFFDNLQVIHTRGPLLEETHYYPFGLTMQGISSKAAGKTDNKKKYNGIEFNEDFDLDTYEAFYRNLDPQTGRFWQIDPKLESAEMLSPYSAMSNNPILYADPLGDIVRNAHDEEVNLATQNRDAATQNLNTSMANYGVNNRNIGKKDFLRAGHTKDEWKDFKGARDAASKAEGRLSTAVRNQFDAQEDINQMQHDNPTLFNAVNNLPVDVFIGRTDNASIVDNGGGANAINVDGAGNVQGRMYNLDDLVAGNAPQWRAGVAIWTLTGRSQASTVRHEVGHTVSMYGGVPALGIGGIQYGGAGNPANVADYIRNFAAGGNCADCRDNRNNCTPTQAAAVAAEQLGLEAANRYIRIVNPNR